MSFEPRRCVICGAKVENINPLSRTCDPICTRARRAGRTREGQMFAEMAEEPYPNGPDGTGCQICGCRFCICDEP